MEDETFYFENGTQVKADLLSYVPDHHCPEVVRDAGLTNGAKWVQVDGKTKETQYEGVYSIGNVNGIMLSNGKILPKACAFAHNQDQAVTLNITAKIKGEKADAVFSGNRKCFIETGGGKAGLGKGNFYAEPNPDIRIHQPAKHWHQGKVFFENDFLKHFSKWGLMLDKLPGFLKKWL